MKTIFNTKLRSMRDISFLTLFILSIMFAMIFCVIYKSEFLLQTDVLARDSLSLVKTYGGDKGSLFLYVLNERIWMIPLLFLLSTTYLCGATVYAVIVWYGISLGMVWSVALLRYGMKGIWFLIFSGFPQYIFYIPALLIALKLSCKIRIPDKRFLVQFLVLECLVVMGVFFEAFVNTIFIHKIIKLFIGV